MQGVKLGDLQATVMGMLSAALFFVISHAKPLEHLSADRPHTMIFSLYVFCVHHRPVCRSTWATSSSCTMAPSQPCPR